MSGVYAPTGVPSGDDAEMSLLLGPTELPCDSPTSVVDAWVDEYSPTEVAPDESRGVHSAVDPGSAMERSTSSRKLSVADLGGTMCILWLS